MILICFDSTSQQHNGAAAADWGLLACQSCRQLANKEYVLLQTWLYETQIHGLFAKAAVNGITELMLLLIADPAGLPPLYCIIAGILKSSDFAKHIGTAFLFLFFCKCRSTGCLPRQQSTALQSCCR
jgi:hypothetical protein